MTTLKVQRRNMETKAKKLRRDGYITGSLFGKEIENSVPIMIEEREAERIQRECLKGSQLYLELDGKTYDVLLKEIDYNALKRQILEMDFQALVKGQLVHCETEIVLHNREKVQEGVVDQLLSALSYKARPEDILDRIDVDCGAMRYGDAIRVADLDIAKDPKVEILTHADTVVVRVIASKAEEAVAEDGTDGSTAGGAGGAAE